MTSLTLSIEEDFKNELKTLSYINWSEIAREESRKKVIFEKYIKTKKVSNKDWTFCEKIDWHPVDELPFKESYIRESRKLSENTTNSIKYNSVDEFINDISPKSIKKISKRNKESNNKKSVIKRNIKKKSKSNSK